MGPISFTCSSCQQAYKVGLDKAGKKTKCFKCGAVLTVPAAPAETPVVQTTRPAQKEAPTKKSLPVAEQETESYQEVARIDPAPKVSPRRRREPETEDEEKESPTKSGPRRRPKPAEEEEDETEEDKPTRRRKRARSRAANWRKVRLGLLLMLVAVCAGIGVMIVLNLFMRISLGSASGIFGNVRSFLTWMRIFQLVTLAQTAVAVTGYCLCLYAPREHYCRKLAVAVLVVVSLDMLAQMVLDPLNLSSMGLGGETFDKMLGDAEKGDLSGFSRLSLDLSAWVTRMAWFSLFLQILSYAKVLLVPLFLWSLTRCLRGSGLTYNAETLLKISFWIVGLGILTQLLFRLPLTVVLHVITPLSWVNLLLGLAQTVWTLLILINTRRAIADKIEGL